MLFRAFGLCFSVLIAQQFPKNHVLTCKEGTQLQERLGGRSYVAPKYL